MRRATVRQTKSGINSADYVVLEKGSTVYDITSNYISKELMTPLRMQDGRQEYSFRRNIRQGAVSIKQYDVMDLYMGREKLGFICGNVERFFGAMTYTIKWAGQVFTMYDAGRGSQGIELPIYENDRQVALVEKQGTVRNPTEGYEVYTVEDELLPMTVLAALYYDRENFSDRGSRGSGSFGHKASEALSVPQPASYDEDWVTPFLTLEERDLRNVKPMPKFLSILLRAVPFILSVMMLFLFYMMVIK